MQRQVRFLRRARTALGKAVAFWTSRPLLLAVVVAILATGFTLGGVRAITWMETPGFCSQCHPMEPEVVAHADSAHETVECAECHVGEGLKGLLKSKWDGLQQLMKLITGSYARPISAGHKMPSASETCLRCHDPGQQHRDMLLTRSYFREDQPNTEQRVALVMRLAGSPEQQTQGIHWHVRSKVDFVAREDGRVIDWIGVEHPDGSREEFIAESLIEISEQAGDQAAALRRDGGVHRMSCYDCHNRVGHSFPNPTRELDEAMQEGRIDPTLPFIKKWSMQVLKTRYPSIAEGYRAINSLAQSYHQQYPNLFLERPDSIQLSLQTLADIYRKAANPDMPDSPQTYPNYLGHIDSTGCFRCHDGGHYKIEDGRLSDEPIPSRCSLCHTFPTGGERAPSVMIGPPPTSHSNTLWVFEHKDEATSSDVAKTACVNCHSKSYCSNCHAAGTTSVQHENMLYDHAAVIREATEQPCSYCHQKPSCERCHEEELNWRQFDGR